MCKVIHIHSKVTPEQIASGTRTLMAAHTDLSEMCKHYDKEVTALEGQPYDVINDSSSSGYLMNTINTYSTMFHCNRSDAYNRMMQA